MVSKMKIARMKDARVLAIAVSGHRGENSQDWKDARVLVMTVSGHRGEDSLDWRIPGSWPWQCLVTEVKIARIGGIPGSWPCHRGEDSQDWKDARVLAMAVSGHRGEDSQDWKDARVLAMAVSVAGLFQSAIVQS